MLSRLALGIRTTPGCSRGEVRPARQVVLGRPPGVGGGKAPVVPRRRRTGRPRRSALVWAEQEGSRYLVSLAGESEWVRNVRAADHRPIIRHGRAHPVRLEEVPVEARPPILKAYLSKRAYSKSPEYEAREFFGVSADPTLEELAIIAGRYPVFRIVEPA